MANTNMTTTAMNEQNNKQQKCYERRDREYDSESERQPKKEIQTHKKHEGIYVCSAMGALVMMLFRNYGFLDWSWCGTRQACHLFLMHAVLHEYR